MSRVPDVDRLPLVSADTEMKTVVVTAAVIERGGRLLVTRRLQGTHLEGYWEFPGGKCDAGESLEACLVRELREELAVDAVVGSRILKTSHDYPERRVELHFFRCELAGDPVPQMNQEMQWVPRDALASLKLPPADDELVALLTEVERH
jgi:8-oxo-dGTP diphosphatase